MLALSGPLPKSPTMIPINTWGLTDLKKHWEKDRQVRTAMFYCCKSQELVDKKLLEYKCTRFVSIYKVCLIKSLFLDFLWKKNQKS